MIRRIDQIEVDLVEANDGAESPSRDETQFDGWLNLVTSLLPEQLRESGIREEIESHLRERVRDLMLAGKEEDAAIHQAVGEFGDAATLARRYAEVTYTHRRRRRMQSILTGFGVLAVAGTTWLVADSAISSAPPPSVFQSAETQAVPEAIASRTVSIETPTTLGAVFEALDESMDDCVVVRWSPLEDVGWMSDHSIDHMMTPLPFKETMLELRQVLGGYDGETLDWRYANDHLEIATRDYFESRERALVRYDVAGIRNSAIASDDDIQTLLVNFASPNDWEENGGVLARMQFVSDQLFIEAPPRIHEKVEWLLNELRTKEVSDATNGESEMVAGLDTGDVVAVEVWELYAPATLARIERVVERDGMLRLPAPFGVVEARGRSFDELEQHLRESLEGILNEPMFSVFTPVNPAEAVSSNRPQ